jgi:TPR repeat protein
MAPNDDMPFTTPDLLKSREYLRIADDHKIIGGVDCSHTSMPSVSGSPSESVEADVKAAEKVLEERQQIAMEESRWLARDRLDIHALLYINKHTLYKARAVHYGMIAAALGNWQAQLELANVYYTNTENLRLKHKMFVPRRNPDGTLNMPTLPATRYHHDTITDQQPASSTSSEKKKSRRLNPFGVASSQPAPLTSSSSGGNNDDRVVPPSPTFDSDVVAHFDACLYWLFEASEQGSLEASYQLACHYLKLLNVIWKQDNPPPSISRDEHVRYYEKWRSRGEEAIVLFRRCRSLGWKIDECDDKIQAALKRIKSEPKSYTKKSTGVLTADIDADNDSD